MEWTRTRRINNNHNNYIKKFHSCYIQVIHCYNEDLQQRKLQEKQKDSDWCIPGLWNEAICLNGCINEAYQWSVEVRVEQGFWPSLAINQLKATFHFFTDSTSQILEFFFVCVFFLPPLLLKYHWPYKQHASYIQYHGKLPVTSLSLSLMSTKLHLGVAVEHDCE